MVEKKVVIVDGIRLASGKFGGALKDMSAADLGVPVVRELFSRNKIPFEICDELIFGNGWQAGVGANVARQISVRAGLPYQVPAFSINKRCGSGLRAVMLAAQIIKAGDAKVIVAGGTESMSNIPYLLDKARWGYLAGNGIIIDDMIKDGFMCPLANCLMGETAENLADQYHISREEQDIFSLNSQKKAKKAIEEGRLKEEILPLNLISDQGKGLTTVFDTDETPRFDTTLEKLSQLKPAFKKEGTITAGSSCPRADNASALLIMEQNTARDLGLEPLAMIKTYTSVGVAPEIMGIGAAEAIKSVLTKGKMSMNTIDLFEINEAFAAQLLACQKEAGFNLEKVNVNGGALALGHPVGSTGSKILITLLYEMRRRKVQFGLVSLCIGGGQGVALIVEQIGGEKK